MNNTCLYHPTQPAHFECYECQTSYCPKCVSKRQFHKFGDIRATTSYFCPKCNVPVTPLAVGSIVTPFWKRLPQFFAYPLKVQPLLLNVALSILGLIFHNSILVNVLLWAVLVKYAYAVLSNTGQGRLEPPEFTMKLVNDKFSQVFKQYFLFFILGGGGVVVAEFWGPLAILPYSILTVIFLPAMIMLLVTNDSVVSALNPQYTITIVGKVGGRYFQMLLFLMLLLSAPAVMTGLSSYFLPDFLQYFVRFFSQNYYTIVAYNLMGYILLQYHDEIGYEVEYENFQEQKSLGGEEAKGPHDDLISQVNVHVTEGMLNEAIDLIEHQTRREIKDLPLSTKYYELLKASRRLQEMVYYGANHLDLLTRSSKIKEACQVYRECLAQDQSFCPNAKTLYKIAGWLVQNNEPKLAVNSWIKFIKAYPDNHLVPDAYFQIARTLIDKLGETTKAKGILQTVINKYPAHQISMDARQRLQELPA